MSYFAPATTGGDPYFAPSEAPLETAVTGDLSISLQSVGVVSGGQSPVTGELVATLAPVTADAGGSAALVGTLTALLPAVTLVATGSGLVFERAACRTYNIEPENRILEIGAC